MKTKLLFEINFLISVIETCVRSKNIFNGNDLKEVILYLKEMKKPVGQKRKLRFY